MGNDISKEIKHIADALEVEDSTCMTPENRETRYINIDPRSPTEGIIRTPIEVKKTFDQSEVCSLKRRWKSEPKLSPEKDDTSNIIFHVLKDDPRSPTSGIIRTPIQVHYNSQIYGETCSNESLNYSPTLNASMIVNVSDCRSPSLDICRTPIQVFSSNENEAPQEIVKSITKERKMTVTTPITSWQTPLLKTVSSSSFVFTDEENTEIRGKRDKQYERDSVHEKENDINLKRKLMFTPETVKTGVKARTPLGSRCNIQDSPSQFLKVMQVQKVDQELSVSENALSGFGHATKIVKKSRPVVEWDSKDCTIIL